MLLRVYRKSSLVRCVCVCVCVIHFTRGNNIVLWIYRNRSWFQSKYNIGCSRSSREIDSTSSITRESLSMLHWLVSCSFACLLGKQQCAMLANHHMVFMIIITIVGAPFGSGNTVNIAANRRLLVSVWSERLLGNESLIPVFNCTVPTGRVFWVRFGRMASTVDEHLVLCLHFPN